MSEQSNDPEIARVRKSAPRRTGTFSPLPREDVAALLSPFAEIATGTEFQKDGLRAAVEQLRFITNAAPLLISYVSPDFRYQFVNQAYADWFGRSIESMVGKSIGKVIGEEAFAVVRPHLEAGFAGKHVVYETLIPYAVGGHRFTHTNIVPDVGEDGTVHGIVGIISDLSDHHRVEEDLARREREFAALIENAPDIISRFDRSLRCIYTNPAASLATGLPNEFLVGKTHKEMGMPEAFCRAADDSLRRIFASGKPEDIAFNFPSPSGRTLYFEASGVPIPDSAGNIETVMTVSRNVTARCEAEAERETLQRRVDEAAEQQRNFLRDVLYSVSEGKFRLCHTTSDLPPPLPAIGAPFRLEDRHSLRALRFLVQEVAAETCGFPEDRYFDLVTAVGETAMNAVSHAGGGEAVLRAAADCLVLQVWVTDKGKGIGLDYLHRAMLERGFTTGATFGHGFWLIMKTADRIYLHTGPEGTTVVVEQERTPPDPPWINGV